METSSRKHPIRLSSNIAAGFVGKAWTTLISLAFVPIYVNLLGVSAYGLFGFYASLAILLSILDLGLSTTLTREVARLSTDAENAGAIRNTLRTHEVIYWIVGSVLGMAVLLASRWISQHWLNDAEISTNIIRQAVMLMGLAIALQWPTALYSGALLGLQQQVRLNIVLSIYGGVRALGAFILLKYVQPDILLFFTWHTLTGAVTTIALAYSAWKSLPASAKGEGPLFKPDILTSNWRFSVGMLGVSVIATILTQLDKVVLSHGLTLEEFGFYSIASSAGVGLNFLVAPIFTSLFPRFNQLIAQDNQNNLRKLYHQGCQLASASVLPLSAVVILFSSEILTIWLHDPITVQNTSLLLSLIALGTMLNSLVTLPYALQLAHGWTKLSFYKNIIALIVLVPLMNAFISLWGAAGAAIAWILLNVSYIFVEVPIMHSRFLQGSLKRWYLIDVGSPLVVSLVTASLSRQLLPPGLSMLASATWILLTFLVAFFCSIFVMPATREWAKVMIENSGKIAERYLHRSTF